MIDLLASSYHDVAFVMEQDFDSGLQLITQARERHTEAKQWQLYCSIYPSFSKDTFMTFDAFYPKPGAKKVPLKPISQIVAETNELKKRYFKGV